MPLSLDRNGFVNHPILKRVVIAKTIGFLIGTLGLLAFVFLEIDHALRLGGGFILWFTIMGAMVGMAGMFTKHPMIDGLILKWWYRGPALAATMSLALLLIALGEIQSIIHHIPLGSHISPWWMIAEGAFIGGIMDWAATRFAGEGQQNAT